MTDVAASIDELGIRNHADIAPVMDRLELTARDIDTASRPRGDRPDRDTRRRATRSVDRPAQGGPAYDGSDYDGLDYDGLDYDDGPSHGLHGPRR